jgi:hypothetical protein
MLYYSCVLTAQQLFLILTAYVQYNFYMCMSQVTSSHFTKYFVTHIPSISHHAQ